MLRKKSKINLIGRELDYKFDIFEEKISETIACLIEELDELDKWFKDNSHRIPDIGLLYPDVSSEEMDLAEEATDKGHQTACLIEYLDSLAELKILYFTKSIEISIKNMFKNAYPEIRTNEVFRWETAKSIFASKGIFVTRFFGYQEYMSLRKVSNSIKHEDELGLSFLMIGDKKSYEVLIAFYEKVKAPCKKFYSELSKNVIENLHSFPEEKLNTLTEYFYERMDDETILRFISKLKTKLQ